MRVLATCISITSMAAFAAGCTTSGTGYGTLRNGDATRITFNWQSSDSVSGSMTATFTDGRAFTGAYFQITSDARIDRLGPLWDGWSPAWRGWRHWYAEPELQFVKYYSGRVLANLAGADGEHLRCRFRLMRPSAGMGGGGVGQCQLSDGKTIDASFPAS